MAGLGVKLGHTNNSQIQCCGSRFEIRCLFDPWIRDPGWLKNQDPNPGSGSGMNIPDLVAENLAKKIFITSILWCGSGSGIQENFGPRIRDGKISDPGTVINILDPNHYSKLGVLSLGIFENLDVQFHQKFRERYLGSSYKLFIIRDLPRLRFSVIRTRGLRGFYVLEAYLTHFSYRCWFLICSVLWPQWPVWMGGGGEGGPGQSKFTLSRWGSI